MPHRHTPRLQNFSYTGTYRYSWTLCCADRRAVFVRASVVSPVLSCLARAAQSERIGILAYCFMPDHVHLLLEGTREDSSAVTFINRAKQASGYLFSREHGQRLWQRTSWDRVLRTDEDTWTVIRYILANPVRAGLVESPLDYPFSGSLIYGREDLLDAFRRPAG